MVINVSDDVSRILFKTYRLTWKIHAETFFSFTKWCFFFSELFLVSFPYTVGDKCPTATGNTLLSVFAVLAGIAGLVVYVNLTLSDKGKIDPADGAKSIGLSFIQVISLLTSFPIAWPQIFVSIFQVGGAVTVLGQHLVNVKCFYPERSEAVVFYSTQIVWAVMPILLPLCSSLVWVVLSKIKHVDSVDAKIKSTVVGLLVR